MPALILVLIRFIRSIGRGLRDPEFRGLFGWVVILLLVGMAFYHRYEGWSWLDSLYFTVITLTTVGYGDFAPQTSAGKVFTMIYIVLGLGALSSFIILLAERQSPDGAGILAKMRERRGKRPSSTTESSPEEPV